MAETVDTLRVIGAAEDGASGKLGSSIAMRYHINTSIVDLLKDKISPLISIDKGVMYFAIVQ